MVNRTRSYAQSRNVRYLFECSWVIGQYGPKTGRNAMEDEDGYCVTTGLAIQYGSKKTEHTADDHAVTSAFSDAPTSQYLYTPLYQGYDK